MMTGATMLTPNGSTGGVPARAHSSSKMWRWTWVQPGPPCSRGQPGAAQPLARQDACASARSRPSLEAQVLQDLVAQVRRQGSCREKVAYLGAQRGGRRPS